MRNDATWSVVKSIFSLAAVFILLASSAQAQWTLIDDFEGLSAGDVVDGTTGPGATWDGGFTPAHLAEVDPSDASNLALQVLGTAGGSVLRGQFNAGNTISAGDTGTLYYRFRTPDAASGTTDHVVGLTDNPALTNFGFKAGLRNTTGSMPDPNDPRTPLPVNNMDVRNGGGYEQVSFLADSAWYELWMVAANTDPGTHEVYLKSDTDPNFAAQTKLATATPADVFDFRVNGATDIVNVYLRSGNNDNGTVESALYFDDFWVNSSARDLSTPAVPEPTGIVLLLTGLGMFLARRRR